MTGRGSAFAERIGCLRLIGRLMAALGRPPHLHSRRRGAANVSHHYDVGNASYRLWLDRNMVYSCAYVRTGTETIDEAQEQKLDHICRELPLRLDGPVPPPARTQERTIDLELG